MKSRSLIPFYRIVPRWLATSCMLGIISCATAAAQDKGDYCEPSPAVKGEFKKISDVSHEDLPYKQRRERQSAMLQELLKKYPDDFHVLKRLQADRRNAHDSDRDALLNEYHARMEKREGDPASVYFYARLLVGRNTKDAIEHLEKLTQRSSDFPWSYLELAQIYNYPNFRDAAKSKENLKKWLTRCPSLMEGIGLLARIDDRDLMGETAKSMRARLESSMAQEDLIYWNNLWMLEFKSKPVPEHPLVRRQIAEDLKRLRARSLNTKEWLSALQAGYRMIDDKEGRGWVETEILRLFPKSPAAQSVVRNRWRDEHPNLKAEDRPEKKQAYYQALLKATAEWIKLWPDDWSVWDSRFSAAGELENTTASEIEDAGESFLKAMEKNEGGVFMMPPATARVAQVYAKRKVATARIPSLLLKGMEEVERRGKRNADSDLYPREDGNEDGNLKYVQWMSWPLLVEAYAKLGEGEKAREVLKQMSEALKRDKPGDQAKRGAKMVYSRRQVTYWQTTAKVAEAENRKLDALSSYQTALAFRPKSAEPKPGKKDELAEDARRLWKELGGTDEGLRAYLARNEASKSAVEAAEIATWDAKVQQLPDFALLDLQGKKWQLADLKGKAAFINLWATWCGPCKAELPYVQKLHEQMKDKKDVLILTLNIDGELGLVEPFMKENKYSFTVIPAQAYVEGMGVYSIPRNWVVSAGGTLQFEGIGFGGEGDEWMKKAMEMIQKVQSMK
jgi:pentatricopeptide repeat protein